MEEVQPKKAKVVEQQPQVKCNDKKLGNLLNIIKAIAELKINGNKLKATLDTIKIYIESKSINEDNDIRKHNQVQLLLQDNQRKIAQLECIYATTRQDYFKTLFL